MEKTLKENRLKAAIKVTTACLVASACFGSVPGLAQVEQSEFDELRAQILMLTARLAKLEESAVGTSKEVVEVKAASESSWTNKVKISGDLRARYENIDDSSKPDSRNRERVRARLGITAKVNDDWNVGFGIASGGDDPISTNQTLGGGSSTKGLQLDYAYFQWTGLENIILTGGKYRNVFFKPGGKNMLFDGDFRPEGLALKFDNGSLFANAATLLLESDDKAGSQDEEFMWGVQAGYEMPLENDTSITFGASYFNAAVSGSEPFYKGKAYSNTLGENATYLYDYEEVELFAQLDFSLQSQPVKLFADFVQNQAASDNDTGWMIGGKYGNVSGAHTWEVGYMYQDLEADAAYGGFADSDFANSGTDGKGHVIDFAYGLGKKTELGLTYYLNEYGEQSLGEVRDYNRFHLFLITSF